ncbi:HNH endonuclease signature motif containing protein [Ilumatobacter coccineus]|uniref:DUF222 domain-containing protein n=1 Tax=Ilumatobacter coccineus (strain NBRC 103263 / KCTC 29153 / YM16-304) TaxID=1313172 RepID=A0A6C7EHT2_ILUCY|nr:HNH endonuclease signature motif containing protein [Ilumatobacter coccineus]BAN04525.1 hypothetical protein YM304_42110 [Ilumatobacter coccineus YM16-304]
MVAADLSPRGVVEGLAAAVDSVARLELDEVAAGEAPGTLIELARLADRLNGEIARVADHVASGAEWRESGATSAAAFLSKATGMAWGRARDTIGLGSAMAECPALDDAVRAGRLSPAAALKVVPALDDDGFGDVAEELIAELVGMTPTRAEQHVEVWRAVVDPIDDTERRRRAEDGRCLSFRPAGDGMTHISGVVPNRIAQSLRRSLKHLADQQRTDQSDRTTQQRRVDALGDLMSAFERGEVTGGRNLPRIIATMTVDDLESRSGVATGSFGETLTSSEIDRLCCDAVIHRYVADQDGAVLNFGRGRRTASPQQFLALTARDGGCRHPGCDRPPEWCEAHHLREFAARGGLTDVDEMVLLCHHHHHALHDHAWTLSGTSTHLVFTSPGGNRLHSVLQGGRKQRSAA